VVKSSRAMVRRGLPALVTLACLTLASCGTRQSKQLSVAQFTAIQQRLAAKSAADATGPAATPAPGAGPAASPGAAPVPPRDDGERRARAAAALPAGVKLGAVASIGNGTRYVLALATVERNGTTVGPNLVVVDVSPPQGVVLGEHDFGLEQPGAVAPTRLGRTFLLDESPEDPVVLAELFLPDGERDPYFGACGWWLRRRKPAFLCAPRLTPDSRFDVHRGELVESWSVDSVGARVPSKAGSHTGRKLRFVEGRWQETDSFRCVGRPLAEAFQEAGSATLSEWQQDTVRRLTKAATRAGDELETDVAIARLQDALAADGCSPETWRLLGRLEFEAGRPQAAATLAVALALAPHAEAALVDLADALAVLDVAKPPQRESWHSALAVLGSRPSTRVYTDGAANKSPRALAAVLCRAFLARTSADDEWQLSRRQKVEHKLELLETPRARGRAP